MQKKRYYSRFLANESLAGGTTSFGDPAGRSNRFDGQSELPALALRAEDLHQGFIGCKKWAANQVDAIGNRRKYYG